MDNFVFVCFLCDEQKRVMRQLLASPPKRLREIKPQQRHRAESFEYIVAFSPTLKRQTKTKKANI